MRVVSKMLGYSTGVMTHVAVAMARILHLSAILPAALRLNKSEDDDAGLVVLHDGDEYVTSVLVETLGTEPPSSKEFIEAIKVETVEPDLEMPDKVLRDKMTGANETNDAASLSPADETSDSLLDSLEPDEEIVELSDEEEVSVAIAGELAQGPPHDLNVVAFNEKSVYHGRKSRDLQTIATTLKGVPYTPTAGGSMVMAPELAGPLGSMEDIELEKLRDQLERAKTLESSRSSDSASVETNGTEATEEDRLRGLSESREPAGKDENDAFSQDKLGQMGLGGRATECSGLRPIGGLSGASSQSSMLSSEDDDDDLSAMRAEFGAPSFLPTIVTATSESVAL